MINELSDLRSVIKIFTLHTFFLSALMSVGMLLSFRRSVKNKIFFGLFLSLSLLIFYFFLFESELVASHTYLSVVCLPGIFLSGPMIYFLAQYSVNKVFEFTFKKYLHVLPAFISLIIGLISIPIYGYEELTFYFNFYGNIIILMLGFLGTLSFTFYLIITGRVLVRSYLWNLNTLRNEPSALASLILFDIFLAVAITDSLSVFTGKFLFFQISVLLVSVSVVLLFILNLVFPSFEKVIGDVVLKEKQRRSYLSNIDTDRLKSKINELIHNEEIFTDSHLTLTKLASLSAVSTHQLSEFINKHYNKNFTSFINEFRVNKAKDLLIKKPQYTILAIAFDVGFHSKSAFNEAFSKIAGISPSQYRNNSQLNNMT